jgi:DNA-binding NarL/FixJ family response regulator
MVELRIPLKNGVAVKRPRLLLVDDHVMFTEGLSAILSPHFEIAGIVEDGEAALAAAARLHPDIIVLDVAMAGLNGIKVARRLQAAGSSSRIVFCTMHADPEFVKEAFAAGAKGYVLKSDAGTEIIVAISEALENRTYVSPRLQAREPLHSRSFGKP